MKHLNCIVLFNQDKKQILFCKRSKDPYKGLYNFVGGKIEPKEDSVAAAYRELYEETGITKRDVRLHRLMDFTYYYQDFVLEIYVGQLHGEVNLREEANPLEWLTINEEEFADSERFAGDRNIAHIVRVAMMYPIEDTVDYCDEDKLTIGVDGCNGGWIAAILDSGKLTIKKYGTIQQLISDYPRFDACLIDMAMGLPENAEEAELRPDNMARTLLGSRGCTVFNIPSRQAVYLSNADEQKAINKEILGKSLSNQSLAIIPKIREIDEFINRNTEYKNVIRESHPELCFAKLNGESLQRRKAEYPGVSERCSVLRPYLPGIDKFPFYDTAKELKCHMDDIVDAIVLAVTGNLDARGLTETVPAEPAKDANGVYMQMVVPK